MAESNATQVILTDDGIKIIKAQNTANNALNGVNSLNDPNLMNVIEKHSNAMRFDGLTSQYNVIIEDAKDDGVDTTALTTAYNDLNNFMAGILADPNHASDIDRATYKKYQDAYNEELAKTQNDFKNSANNEVTSAANQASQAAAAARQAFSAAQSVRNSVNNLIPHTHIAYANSADGKTDFSVSDSNRTYLGMYVDFSYGDSTNSSDYTWSLIKGHDGAQGIPGKAGADGKTPYFHIAYADSSDGKTNFSLDTPGSRKYIGSYTDFTQADSENQALYSWQLVQGPKGEDGDQGIPGKPGADGKTQYTHIAYANSATGGGFSEQPAGKTFIGMYVDFEVTDSTDVTKYNWSLIKGEDGAQGIPGKDGKTSYTHIAYADTATGGGFSQSSDNKKYIGIYTDFIADDSNDVTNYSWSLIKGADGANGKDGVPGKAGADGKTPYFHIAYADSSDGNTNFSLDTPGSRKYIGSYTDFTQADSTNPSAYSWQLVQGPKGDTGDRGLQGLQGPQGDQGIKGPAGADGKSSYTHIAYGTSSSGAGFTQTPSASTTYIGMYVDQIATDSNDPADYAWSLIKGEDGSDGIPGKAGADGKTPYLHIAYANSADGKNGFYVGGGTNLLTNTGEFNANWGGMTSISTIVEYDGHPSMVFASSPIALQLSLQQFSLGKLQNSTQYTASFWAKADNAGDKAHTELWGSIGATDFVLTTNWVRYTAVVTSASDVNTNISHSGCYFGAPTGNKGNIYISEPKLELGTTATPWSPAPSETHPIYMGTYTDFTQADSLDPTAYQWSQIKGDDGAQGIPGKAGADGKTPYFHQAWADSSDGKTNFSTTISIGKKYLGTYTDYVAADSTDPTIYKWTELVGAMQVGGRNLYLNSKAIADGYGIISSATSTLEPFDSDTNMWHIVAKQGAGGLVGIYLWGYATDKLPGTSDWSYSADVKGTGKVVEFGIEAGNKNPIVGTIGSEWSRISQTGHFDNSEIRTIVMYFDSTDSPIDVYIKLPKLESGNMPTDWTPAPEDQATQSQIIKLRDDISLFVEKGDLLSQINMQAGYTLITASKQLTLSSNTIYFDTDNPVVIPSANITGTLEGKKLKTADIEADTFSTKNKTFVADSDGKITAKNMTLTGGVIAETDIKANTFSTNNGTFQVDKNGVVTANNLIIRNLVYNASLLGGNGNTIPGWSISNNGYYASNMVHDGVPSIEWNNTTGAGVWTNFAQTKLYPLNGLAGLPFSASVWFLEMGSDTSLLYQVTLAFFDSNGNRINGGFVGNTWNGISSRQDWRYVTIDNAVAPSNAISVGLQYWAYNGKGSAAFSSPMLTQTAHSTGYQPDTGNIVSAGIIDSSVINTPTLNLGTNGTLTTDFDINQDTGLYAPKKGTGTLTIKTGVINSSSDNMSRYSNTEGYWYGFDDNGSMVKNGTNHTGDDYAPGYVKHDIMKSNGNVLNRSYMDAMGLMFNEGGTQTFNTLLTAVGLDTGSALLHKDLATNGTFEAALGTDGTYGFTIGSKVIAPMIQENQVTYSANIFISRNGYMALSTSTKANKLDIVDVPDMLQKGYNLLTINPRQWFDKTSVEAYADLQAGNTDSVESVVDIKPVSGLVAEEVASAGLDDYVTKDENNKVQGLAYDRLWTLLLPVLRDMNNRLNEAQLEITKLKRGCLK